MMFGIARAAWRASFHLSFLCGLMDSTTGQIGSDTDWTGWIS
jgi:hypothetical protein